MRLSKNRALNAIVHELSSRPYLALLLSLEQLLYNDTHSEAQNQFHGQRISINNKALCLDKNVYSQIAKFIPLLTNNSIHTHMKSTILQIMYIIMDINQGVEILYQGGLVNALADMLRISVQENRQYLTYSNSESRWLAHAPRALPLSPEYFFLVFLLKENLLEPAFPNFFSTACAKDGVKGKTTAAST